LPPGASTVGRALGKEKTFLALLKEHGEALKDYIGPLRRK